MRRGAIRRWVYSLKPYRCLDCGVDTPSIGEYYMVRDGVWLRANPAGWGMLCIGCLEQRLGRRLGVHDFTLAPINFDAWISPRLRERIFGRPS